MVLPLLLAPMGYAIALSQIPGQMHAATYYEVVTQDTEQQAFFLLCRQCQYIGIGHGECGAHVSPHAQYQ